MLQEDDYSLLERKEGDGLLDYPIDLIQSELSFPGYDPFQAEVLCGGFPVSTEQTDPNNFFNPNFSFPTDYNAISTNPESQPNLFVVDQDNSILLNNPTFNQSLPVMDSIPQSPPTPERYLTPSPPTPPSPGSSEDSSDRKKKRARKRPKKEKLDFKPTAVTLPREQLLTISSEEMDRYAQQLATSRALTPEEEKDIKRQKRLIKNRESAQASRYRKKAQVGELEQKIEELNSENAKLHERLANLEAENRNLKDEVVRLQDVIKRNNLLSDVWSTFSFSKKNGSPTLSSAGICLMIVLFTFGGLLQPFQNAGPRTPIERISSNIFPFDQEANIPNTKSNYGELMIESDISQFQTENSPFPTGRRLLCLSDDMPSSVAVQEITTTTTTTTTLNSTFSASTNQSSSIASTSVIIKSEKMPQETKKRKADIELDNCTYPIETEQTNTSIVVTTSTTTTTTTESVIEPPNTTCIPLENSELNSPVVLDQQTIDPNASLLITLLIPPNVLRQHALNASLVCPLNVSSLAVPS